MADGSSVPRNEGGKEFEMLIMCAGYERKRPPGDGIVRAVESEPPIVPWCEAKTRSSAGAKGMRLDVQWRSPRTVTAVTRAPAGAAGTGSVIAAGAQERPSTNR